jgi:hypothetical protein
MKLKKSFKTLSKMNTKLKVYTKQNSKPIVKMDSPHRHASFSCKHILKQTMVVLI